MIKSQNGIGRMITLVMVSLFFFSGCASHQQKSNHVDQISTFNKWKMMAESSPAITPVPEQKKLDIPARQVLETSDLKETPDTEKKLQNSEVKLPELPVTMRMNNVAVPVLLRMLARIADINIMINDSVQGKMNVNLEKVPWNQAFLSLLDTHSLTHEWSGSILRIITVDDLNKKKALMEARHDFEQSKRQQYISLLQIKEKQNKFEPLLTRIIRIHYADLVSLKNNLETYLKTDLTDSDGQQPAPEGVTNGTVFSPGKVRGSIMIDEFTNSLIIQATRQDLQKMMPIINELDKPIKQVLIEAHIVEANSDIAKELGIQWGGLGLGERGNNRRYWLGSSMGPSGTSLKDEDGVDTSYNPSDGNIVNLPITAATPAKGLAFGLMAESIGNFRLYAQLSALEDQGELNIISKPSITTMNHRKATIKSGEEVPFQTISADGEIQVEFKEAVIKLEVIPHIIGDNIIRLEILTHKDELDWTQTVNGNPTIITKNAQTIVTLFDGQTTVIGGLNKEKTSDGETGIPVLKDVPGLGWLFKSTLNTKDKEELLIFITPHVLKEQKNTRPSSSG